MKRVKLILALGSLGLSCLSLAVAAAGPETEALLRVLVRKGLLTDAEAREVRADMMAETDAVVRPAPVLVPVPAEPPTPPTVRPNSSRVDSVVIYGELQAQYYALQSDQPLPVNEHFVLRRARVGVRATMAEHWTADVLYNFPSQSFHKAVIGWTGDFGAGPMAIYAGLAKPKVAYEENFSSSSLEALERSGATRFFVESNNGRRLAASSLRVGLFLEGNPEATRGRQTGWFYGAALTNAERSNVGTDTASPIAGASHRVAPWGHVGYSAQWGKRRLLVGVAAGLQPDQGGVTPTAGENLATFSAFADFRAGRLRLVGEILGANVEAGRSSGVDARPFGYWLQSEWQVTEPMALVLRYSSTDADGRGINLSDVIRSAPAVVVGEHVDELYAGFNHNLVGRDLRFQLGYVYGRVAGRGPAEVVGGVRAQIGADF